MMRIPIPGTKTMNISRIILKTRVLTNGTATPVARDSNPRTVVLCCRARKSTNLALDGPFRHIITHLMRSNVAEIVAAKEMPASSEKMRRKKME
jgi:hypothetical protein